MGMNETPSANRIHIGFFGRRNAGKSSLINAVTGQDLAVVSKVKGTTTDPVKKAMELLPIGPVVLIDTPGFDDEGALGELRVKKTRQILNQIDLAVLVAEAGRGMGKAEEELTEIFCEKGIPFLIVYNKADLLEKLPEGDPKSIYVSAREGMHIRELKERIAGLKLPETSRRPVGDLVKTGDTVLLIVPIDSAAPKGRLILPQQQVIRDLLEAGAVPVIARETEIGSALNKLREVPALAITDSQVFARAAKELPENVPLTSFSILMARYKGALEQSVQGAAALRDLREGDRILICEGCTHHRQCEDIGTVKLPGWISAFTKQKLEFTFVSGGDFPENLSDFRLIIHCGGCMLNEREMSYRMKCARDADIPVTNYGTAIAYINGILERSLAILPDLQKLVRQ